MGKKTTDVERLNAENTRLRAEVRELRIEHEACSILLASKSAHVESLELELRNLQRHFAGASTPPDAEWREVNMPFGNLLSAVVDSARLVGLELEIDGNTFLVGDVNPDGGQFGQINQAFRRNSVVTRARVRVKK